MSHYVPLNGALMKHRYPQLTKLMGINILGSSHRGSFATFSHVV